MAKIAFSKLALKKQEEIKTIDINNNVIEVKQYLPINDKFDLIARVIEGISTDQNGFKNPVKIEVIASLEIIMAYSNLSFTEKQKEDIGKLYDLLEENDVINQIISVIPQDEYEFLINGIQETIDAIYVYRNSILGILDSVSQDYSNLNLDAESIQAKLADKENIALLKDVLTKLG